MRHWRMILDLEKTCVGGNKEAKGDKKGNGTLRTSSSFYTQETTHLSCPVKIRRIGEEEERQTNIRRSSTPSSSARHE
jgi:hypothetical protein